MAKGKHTGGLVAGDSAELEANHEISVDNDAMPDFTKFEDEQVGFTPYWEPVKMASFYAALMGIDLRDPEFIRYQFACMQPTLECFKGSKVSETVEPVTVKKGELFSVSVYAQLRGRFDEYLDFLAEGFVTPIYVTAEKKSTEKAKNGFPWWVFRVQVSPEVKKQLAQLRASRSIQLRKAASGQAELVGKPVSQLAGQFGGARQVQE